MAMIILAMGTAFIVLSQLEYYSRTWGRSVITTNIMAQAKEALLGYAATYRDRSGNDVFGYLPCPDTTGDGTEAGNCDTAGNATVGLLPFKSLGLPDLRDSDGVCLWYAVSGRFKAHPQGTAANPTAQPLNWDTQGQFAIVGTAISPDSGDGGAAAIIFAAGAPLTGQNRNLGGYPPCDIDPTTISDYLDGNYNFGTNATISIAPGIVKDGSGNVTNNDLVAWITPKEIFDRVIKRSDFGNGLTASPVGQINKLSSEIKAVLEKRIQDDLVAGSVPASSLPEHTGNYPGAGKQVGDLPPTMTLNDASYNNYYSNWNDQYRSALCSNLSTTCLTIAGTACRGVLMFGGRATGGQPRSSTQKISGTANLGNFFEAAGLDLLNSTATTFVGNTAYAATSPSSDVANCLFPGTFLSFAQDINAFASGIVTSVGGTPAATVSAAANSISLGSAVTGTLRSDCVWYPTAIPLGSMMRIYFRYQVTTRGRGFNLAIADASTNNPANTSPVMCGGTGSALLGYAGAPPTGQATKGGTTVGIDSVAWSSSSGGTATINTTSSHGFSDGDTVTISGVVPTAYNGIYANINSTGSRSFTYSLPLAASPGTIPAGIKPPKLGLEFDTNQNTSQLDPSSDHFAFVYWGSASDNTSAGNGSDDNTHYEGILGSGAEPLNPRETGSTPPTATPVAGLSAATWSAGAVTATTLGPHGFTSGQYIYVADVTPTTYGSTSPVTVTVTDSTHFTYPLTANPGIYANGTNATRTAKASSMSSGTVTTAQAHGFAVGQYVNMSGFTNAVGCNGLYQISSVVSATKFTLASNTSTCSSAGYATATNKISTASWVNGIATVTTTAAHGLAAGQYVNIANIYPAGYNGTHVVTPSATDPAQFTYSLTADPGATYSANATPGLVTVSSLDATTLSSTGSTVPLNTLSAPYNGDDPQNGVIHVRLDIARSYDAAAHQATLSMKAYIADKFGVLPNTCAISDFKNLSLDLSTLCTQGAAIEQDGIPINDVSASALSSVYVGFTTARATSSSSNQNLTISNFMLRSQ